MSSRVLRCLITASAALAMVGPQSAAGAGGSFDYATDAHLAWGAGFTGQGQTIGILDSGIDSSHAWFDYSIAAEACFGPFDDQLASACAGGASELFGPGAALPTLPPETPLETWIRWMHGTRVSGAAVGAQFREFGFPIKRRGIAPDARIAIANVTHQDVDAARDPDISDTVSRTGISMVEGFDWLLEQRAALGIDVVSISASATRLFSGNCDTVALTPRETLERGMINRLIAGGVPVVVAAGNFGGDVTKRSKLGFPACLSNVVTVGSVDHTTGLPSDFSPRAKGIDVLAPGEKLMLPMTDGPRGRHLLLESKGTSYAAPMVAAAIALYREKYPEATPAEIKARLMSTGPKVTLTDATRGPTAVVRRSLRVDKLLGLRAPAVSKKFKPQCVTLHLRPKSEETPNIRYAFARFHCRPTSIPMDRHVVLVDGPNSARPAESRTTPDFTAAQFAEKLVKLGPSEGIRTERDQQYRVCYLFFPASDRISAEKTTVCDDFET